MCLWNYFTKLDREEDNISGSGRKSGFAECNKCKKVIELSQGSTSGIKAHLKYVFYSYYNLVYFKPLISKYNIAYSIVVFEKRLKPKLAFQDGGDQSS